MTASKTVGHREALPTTLPGNAISLLAETSGLGTSDDPLGFCGWPVR
jgi:hypothetical protein